MVPDRASVSGGTDAQPVSENASTQESPAEKDGEPAQNLGMCQCPLWVKSGHSHGKRIPHLGGLSGNGFCRNGNAR